jgi:Protein of unknown function (DUF2628)
MIVCTVHEPGHPQQALDARADDVVFIKEGFTWWGFLFTSLWLLFNALWLEFIGVLFLAVALAAGLVEAGLRDQVWIVSLLFMLLIGFEGNGLKRWRLERKGYVYLASVAGDSLEDCERRFFDAWLPSKAPPQPKTPPSPGPDVTHSSWGDWPGPGTIGTLPGEAL